MRGPTERTMLDALWARCGAQGMNPTARRHVLAEQVRYDPTFGDAIADAISVDTWRSGRFALHGYEVKVTRSDYLRELRDPGKHAAWARHCTYWWIVVPDRRIVAGDTLEHIVAQRWGVLALEGRWLRVIRPAPRLETPQPLPAAALAGLMRATAQTATRHTLTPAQRLLLDRGDPSPSLAALRATLDPR